MKKLFAILMALCMLLSCAALAEAAEEVNWSDVEATLAEAGVTGEFATFDEIAVKIWIPEGLPAVELTDEDRENGYIGYFQNDEAQLAVVYVNVDGMSIEDYAAALAETDGVENIAMLNINGLPGVRYQMPENDTLNIAFATEAGYILEVTMAPLSADSAAVVWGIVGASIQAE